MIELRHLRYIVAAAEHGSFRAAGKALAVRESAISRRIRDLEDELGVALFIRSPSGVALTFAGERFLAGARGALNQVGHAAIDAAAFGRGESGTVRIGILSSLGSGFLPSLLHDYIVSNPGVRPELVEGGTSDHLAALRRNRLDVAFLKGEPQADGCDKAHFWDERVYVIVPTGHELAAHDEVSWSDLHAVHFIVTCSEPGPSIHDYLVRHLSDLARHPSVEYHAVGRDNLMHLIAIGRGLSLTMEGSIATEFPGIVYKPLATELLPFFAVWRAANDNPALRRLLSLARQRTMVRHNALPVRQITLQVGSSTVACPTDANGKEGDATRGGRAEPSQSFDLKP